MAGRARKESYSASLTVTERPWSKTRTITAFAFSAEEATAQCLELAHQVGWAAPAWWQWWRRRDSIDPYVASCFTEM